MDEWTQSNDRCQRLIDYFQVCKVVELYNDSLWSWTTVAQWWWGDLQPQSWTLQQAWREESSGVRLQLEPVRPDVTLQPRTRSQVTQWTFTTVCRTHSFTSSSQRSCTSATWAYVCTTWACRSWPRTRCMSWKNSNSINLLVCDPARRRLAVNH